MRPYTPPPSNPNIPHGQRTPGANGQWGNLPPRLRDDILQSQQQDFILDYRDRLKAYYKLLAGDE